MKSKSRKILIIVENLPVPFDTRVWQEATTLATNGYTVSVICPKGKGYTQEEEYLQGVHIFRHDLPAEGNGAVGYAKEYFTALKEELRLAKKVYKEIGFDVIHGCNPPDDIYMVPNGLVAANYDSTNYKMFFLCIKNGMINWMALAAIAGVVYLSCEPDHKFNRRYNFF